MSLPVLQAEEKCKVEERELYLQGAEVVSGGTFGAYLHLDKHESVRWEVRGGDITSAADGGVNIVAGAPGVLEIDAFVSKNEKKCELQISRSVPIVCVGDPDRYMWISHTESAQPGDVVGAFANAYFDQGETLTWNVRGGTIESTDGINVRVIAGAPGTLEIDAVISKGACSFTLTRSVPIACADDPTIGLYFDKGGVRPGETLTAWTYLDEGESARWEIVNGTPSTATGDTVQITAGASGLTEINLYVTHDGYCVTHRRSFIFIHQF